MRIGEKMRKWISMILCLCMLVQNAPMMVFAASTDNLCEHHPKHTEDCGYVEAVAGSACTHKHSEACYKIVECKHTCSDECGDPCTTHTCTVDDGCITMEWDCHHVHGECGYAEAVEPQDCTTCQPVLVHAKNCSYVESADEVTCDCEPTVIHGGEGCTYVEGKDGSPCTHVCAVVVDSDDSCYKLLCSHKDGGHDDACGYAAAVEGHECHYECSACEDNAGDDSPVPEGVCAHGNSEESCETCVGEIQVMINALPDMEDIGDHNRADVISQLEAIDDRMCKLSGAAKGKLNADKYSDAAFVLSAPEGFFGFILSKSYEAGASAMPQASFAFLDASGAAATVITPEKQQTTSVEPVSNGGAVRGYLPVGEYTLDETVVGDWNLTMSVNGQAEGDHTFTGEGGRAYRIETINIQSEICLNVSGNGLVKVKYAGGEEIVLQDNKCKVIPYNDITLTVEPESGYVCVELKVMDNNGEIVLQKEGNTYTFQMPDEDVNVTVTFKPLCEHTTEKKENQATCKKQAVCDFCGESYGDVNKKNHDETVEYDNGFCSYCGAYQSATQNAEGYYEISNAGQLYWFAEQVNSSGNYSINGKLMEDILVNENVLNSAGIVSSGSFRTWYPIGSNEDVNYSGTFNGNGKTISGLYFDNDYVDGVGLFGYVDSGEIQNVGIKDSYFNGRNNVGSVVAHNHKGTVTGCYNTGTVSGGSNVGGVVGKNEAGTVTDCYNSGLIGSYDCNNVGGVLGGNIGTVSNCYNTGLISGQDCVGGVAGYSGGKVSNCYNTGEVYGQNMVGGVLGLNESGSTLSNCYYLTGTANGGINGADAAGKAEAKTTKQFASGEVAYLLGEPFGQNIDNDQPKQEIPCFSNEIVYAVKNCKEETVYSNTNKNIGHKWENGKCSICDASCSHSGSQHTTGTPKDEGTHSYTCSICRSVATENHTFDSTTGKCQYCKTDMAVASVKIGDTTTYFETLADAVTKAKTGTAEAPATLTLLKDIDQGPYEQLITSGVMILDLNGCKLEGSHFSVLNITGDTNGKPDVTITDSKEGGTISATKTSSYGVRANNSTVEISGGTITGTMYGVNAENSTVTITGDTVIATGEGSYGSNGSYGVYANNSTVEITGGTISGGDAGVYANESNIVTISGGTITATGESSVVVHAYNSTVEITGGEISGTDSGVYAYNSTVTITGGTITGGNYDLLVLAGSITLGLGKDGTGATFPDGLNVDGTTLKAILGERAAYWQNDKMLTDIDGYSISGDVTVKAECEHGNATYPAEYITNTQHKVDCPCGYVATEDHTFDSTTGKCQYCKTEMAEAKVEIGGTTPTYFETLYEAVTKAGTGTAEAPATLTLLKDIDLEYSYQEIKSGVMILDLNGCKLTGSDYYVLDITGNATGKPDVTITDSKGGGTITGAHLGVVAENSDVNISGGTISGGDAGVHANESSIVTISGGTVTAAGGTFTATRSGVKASSNSTVEITGGAISGESFGVHADSNSDVNISGGAISGESSGVYAFNSTVEISGGTITGGNYDLEVSDTGSITLGLGKDGTVATFPGGLNVDGTTLKAILGEGAAYWQEDKMIFLSDGQTEITDGDVTVKAECEHGNATYPAEYITNTQHKVDCPCSYVATEDHTFDSTTGKCSACGAREIFFEANVSWNKVYAYYWVDSTRPPVTWPGVELTKNDGDPRYRLVVPGDTTHIIFNDGPNAQGQGNQTYDLELGVKNCYHYDGNNSYWYIYPCTEHTWGKDGKCSNCRTPCPHNTFDSTTGKCQYCKTEMAEASVKIGDTTTYYKTLDAAITDAESCVEADNAVVTLLKDIDLGTSYQRIGSGVFTLDLNGCILTGSHSSYGVLCLYECNLTITDGSAEQDGTITGTNRGVEAYNSTVEISGGTISGYYGVNAHNNSTVRISSGTITATNHGVQAYNSTLKISGGTITGTNRGVEANNSTVEISDGTVTATGEDSYGVHAYNSTVKISGGKITGTKYGVYAYSNSAVTINGGTITANKYGVSAEESTVKISGGTITGTNYGVNANGGTVTITGGTVSGDSYGVKVRGGTVMTITDGTISGCSGVDASINSTVEISGGKITGNGEYSYGVYATSNSAVTITGGEISATGKESSGVSANKSTVTISGGEISATGENSYGVYADESTVEISGGTITDKNSSGVRVESSTVTITGGTITGEFSGVSGQSESIVIISGGIISGKYGVTANKSTVTITGGTITGEANDLRVLDGGSIILDLGEDDIGATFPEGLTVDATTLVDILAEGAAYWQGTKMLTNIADDAITITGGTVTVKAVCKHTDVTYPDEHITDTHHTQVCSCGYVMATESHTRTYTASGNVITDSCSQCKATFGTATITANDKIYNGEPVTAAVQKTGALTDSSIGITYSQNGEELNESAIRAGTYTASIKLGNAVAKVNFTITPATLPNAVLSATGYTYNGQQQKPAVTVNGLRENTDYTVTYPQDVTNAGEKTVTITGKGNYTGTVTKSYSIAKADSAVTKAPQAAANLVYNGKNQNLVIAGTVTGGTLQYSLDGKTWAAKIPVGKAAGTYTVSYKVVGDANHKDIAVRTLAVTIAKGTAPAVDALVQTHFYAYATANTVDLAKYLPADRGTTAYTAIGVSADIFSSALTVTNAGVLSYTTRKLTAAPASDTQISIKVVMENYADAELTVIVKLLAVTEQTQQKIVKEELTEVPAGLAGTRFHSVNAIKTEQKRVLGLLLGYDPQGNILHYDVKLQFSPDGGKTWVDATEENFPANGLTVTLPYPSGTGKDTHNFVVSHMFTTGAKAGTIETPAVTKTADGIRFTVTGLSPVSVAWSAIPFDVKVANVTNGTVCVSSAQAAAGTQVTITATPKSGYRLSTLTVKDAAGNFCVVSTDNNGKYYFTMPAADVTVTATFTAKSTAVADTTNPKTGDDSNLVFWNSMAMTSLLALAVLMLNKKKLHQK